MGTASFTPRSLNRALCRLHNRLKHRLWCHPDKGIVGHCLYDTYREHALGLRATCTTCGREKEQRL